MLNDKMVKYTITHGSKKRFRRFIFFKFQERVFVLMPDLDSYNTNYYSFDVLLGLVSVFKLMSLFFKIYFE